MMDINIKGTIIPNEDKKLYEFFGIDSVCPNDALNAINQANGDDIDVYINSGGGEIFSATEIYSALQAYKGNVKIHVVGLAASAASIIMCASDCDISPTSIVMIHNVSSSAEGDHRSMSHQSNVLRTADKAMCQAYVNKTGKSEKELLKLMADETWLTAREAVELGLCDRISGRDILVNSYCTMITDKQRQEYADAKKCLQTKLNLLEVKVNEKEIS